jgi:hypothetical protein
MTGLHRRMTYQEREQGVSQCCNNESCTQVLFL